MSRLDVAKVTSVALVRMCEPRYFQLFNQVCEKIFNEAKIDNLDVENVQNFTKKYDVKVGVFDHSFSDRRKEALAFLQKLKARYKFTFEINDNKIADGTLSNLNTRIIFLLIKN